MKRKVVVTMSLAWWAEDKYWENNLGVTNEWIIQEIENMDETSIMEACEEANVIKVEITEVKP